MNSGGIKIFIVGVSRLYYILMLFIFLIFVAAGFRALLMVAVKYVAVLPELALFDTVAWPRMMAVFAGLY